MTNHIKHWMMQWNLFDQHLSHWLHLPQQVLLLLLRLMLAWVFFKSGLLKWQSWDSTLELFAYEYAVPLLPPTLAACLGTAAELILPPLLALGILLRPVTLALFVFNAVAMLSYPDISPAGSKDHQLWGLGFIVLFFLGAGRFSLGHLMMQRHTQPHTQPHTQAHAQPISAKATP